MKYQNKLFVLLLFILSNSSSIFAQRPVEFVSPLESPWHKASDDKINTIYRPGKVGIGLNTDNFSAQLHVVGATILDGQVGIGTDTTGSHRLAVEGTIGAREVLVETGDWSDFVFENDYDLMPLSDLQQYIQERRHLPEIPSEKEVIANGIELGKMNKLLLQKIEELTLYILQQEERIKVLEAKSH